jgi:hypothetical protein
VGKGSYPCGRSTEAAIIRSDRLDLGTRDITAEKVGEAEVRRNKMSMLDWSTYSRQLTVRIGEIAKLSPDTI